MVHKIKYTPVVYKVLPGKKKFTEETILSNEFVKDKCFFPYFDGHDSEARALIGLREQFDTVQYASLNRYVIQAWIICEDVDGTRSARLVYESPKNEFDSLSQVWPERDAYLVADYELGNEANSHEFDLEKYNYTDKDGNYLLDRQGYPTRYLYGAMKDFMPNGSTNLYRYNWTVDKRDVGKAT